MARAYMSDMNCSSGITKGLQRLEEKLHDIQEEPETPNTESKFLQESPAEGNACATANAGILR